MNKVVCGALKLLFKGRFVAIVSTDKNTECLLNVRYIK